MMEKTKFYLTLQTGDWDPAIRGWRCSALAIPGAKVDSLLVQGRKIESHKYEVDASTRFLLWRDKTQPRDVTLLIELEKALTSEEETDRWKKLAVILPFCAALISAIVMYFTRQCPGPVPPVPVLDCKSSNPAFICSKTFKELYKKWPDIFAPLENFLRQPTLIYSTRDAVLTLREIKGNKARIQKVSATVSWFFDSTSYLR